MTNIHKISEITGLSVRTLKKIDRHGFLKVSKSNDPIADAARANLKKGNRLTAVQQLHLLKNPKVRKDLESFNSDLSYIMDELGDALEEGAPWLIAVAVPLASSKDADAIAKVAGWLRGHILSSPGFDDGKSHDHAYLAVRLLANVPDHQIENIAPKLTSCMWQCRNHESLQGFWKVEQGRTFYFRPKNFLDL